MRGRMILRGLLLVVLTAGGAALETAAASTASSNGTVDVAKTSALGTVLVGSNGHTLYRYTVDGKNINRCSNVPACKTYWPALLVKAGTRPTVGTGASAKLVGTIDAGHGMRQVTYAGFPLYFFAGDKKAGQTNGQEFQEKWYVVDTRGRLVEHAATATTTNETTTTSSGGYGYG